MPAATQESPLLQTPFYQFHVDHGAKMVGFAGWLMPIMYSSIHEEHRLVREGAGLFDVSHMARFRCSGRGGLALLERVLTRRVSEMKEGSCRYSLICNQDGGTLDDVIVYRFDDHWLVVANASNRQKILLHLHDQVGDLSVQIEDQTRSTAMVALQGPRVIEAIGQFSSQVQALKRYTFCTKSVLAMAMVISRTGYTGEDGVEVIFPAQMAAGAVGMFMKDSSSQPGSIQPAGLGARDTLRLEAGMPLYGHELDEQTDPLAAGLGFAVTLDKPDPFIGQEALNRIAAQGPSRQLVGLRLDGRRTARQGMAVYLGQRVVGRVTSGCLSPTLGVPIALAYLDAQCVEVGHTVAVTLGSKRVDAQIVGLPFYKRNG